MTKAINDVLDKIELKLKNNWWFHSELHRAHHKYIRESFPSTCVLKGSPELTVKHIHLSVYNTEWNATQYNHIYQKIHNIISRNHYYHSNIEVFGEFRLIQGMTLYPSNDLADGLTYSFIKNLLFPMNLKKAITLLNYEYNSLFKVLSQIIVLNKINEENINDKHKI